MAGLNEKENGLEELISAMNTTLPQDVMCNIGYRIKEIKLVIPKECSIITRAVTGTYLVLMDETQLGPKAGKPIFNMIIKKSVNNVIKGHENQMRFGSPLENLSNYIKFARGSDMSVEPHDDGLRVEMKNGCMYKEFCKYVESEYPKLLKCPMGTELKHLVHYFQPEPYQFLLQKGKGLESCTIDVIPNSVACEAIVKFKAMNQPLIPL